MTKHRILVDLDGVLADFQASMAERWRQLWPEDDIEPYLQRAEFKYDVSKGQIPDLRAKFDQIWSEPGFFSNLKPIEGGVEAITELDRLDYDVRIVSSASTQLKAFSEKAEWVSHHLGEGWVRRLVITSDKHFIDGHVLIDDRPAVAKGLPTSWQQIIYTQPYNLGVEDLPRLTWSDDDWLETIEQTVAKVEATR